MIKKPSSFNLEFYFPALKKEFASFGIGVEIEQKVKVEQTDIQSAFIKSNALTLLLSFFPNSEEVKKQSSMLSSKLSLRLMSIIQLVLLLEQSINYYHHHMKSESLMKRPYSQVRLLPSYAANTSIM